MEKISIYHIKHKIKSDLLPNGNKLYNTVIDYD